MFRLLGERSPSPAYHDSTMEWLYNGELGEPEVLEGTSGSLKRIPTSALVTAFRSAGFLLVSASLVV